MKTGKIHENVFRIIAFSKPAAYINSRCPTQRALKKAMKALSDAKSKHISHISLVLYPQMTMPVQRKPPFGKEPDTILIQTMISHCFSAFPHRFASEYAPIRPICSIDSYSISYRKAFRNEIS